MICIKYKNRTLRPWKASFLRQNLNDLYLEKQNDEEDYREYKIINEKGALVLNAKCHVNQGIPHLIEIYSFDSLIVKIYKDFSDYYILKNELLIGKFHILKDRLCLSNIANELIYSAILISRDNIDVPSNS